MVDIWTKNKIALLSMEDINQWFDVLNQGLVEDRGYQLDDPNIDKIREGIKQDYIDYLLSCTQNNDFHAYYVFRYDKKDIVSVCRVTKEDGKYYLEGLETHRDYYRQGFASKLLYQVMLMLKNEGVKQLHSVVRNHNKKSLNFHIKQGFVIDDKDKKNAYLSLNIDKGLKVHLFNDWAIKYNKDVNESEKAASYPFAGYTEIKNHIIHHVLKKSRARVLDMGVGSGEISLPLYHLGYDITGLDFSVEMIHLAKEKMSNARFILGDFEQSINDISDVFDYIIFSYSIHHLSYELQVELLLKLSEYLLEDGLIIIGDVSTISLSQMNQLKNKFRSIWDDEEFYPILDIYSSSRLSEIYQINYIKVNEVAGIFVLRLSKYEVKNSEY